MDFIFKFRYKDNYGLFWNRPIKANSEAEAIKQARELIDEHNYKNGQLVKIVHNEQLVYDFDKE